MGEQDDTKVQKKVRIILISANDKAVGKNQILNRLTGSDFSSEYYATIGASFKSQTYAYNEQSITFEFWNTSSAWKYQSLLGLYCGKADQILLVFDVTDKSSFENLASKLSEIKSLTRPPQTTQFFVVGNKSDKENKQVSEEDVKAFCERNKLIYCPPVSAKTGDNIDHLEQLLIENAMSIEIQMPTVPEAHRYHSTIEQLNQLNKQLKKQDKTEYESNVYSLAIDDIIDQFNQAKNSDLTQEHIEKINKSIHQLQWAVSSMLNSAINAFFVITVVGVIAQAICNCFRTEKKNPFSFFSFGLKQQVEAIVANDVERKCLTM